MAGKDLLGVPAVRQIMARLSKNEQEEHQMIEKLEKNCKTFDRKGKGSLTADEYFNVVKLQNGIDIAKEELKAILGPLPKDKDGRIKIQDFLHKDIHSPEAFKAIDRNKDGFITRGELKLAKKNVEMKDIVKCITDHDLDKDGKLNMEEFQKSKKK